MPRQRKTRNVKYGRLVPIGVRVPVSARKQTPVGRGESMVPRGPVFDPEASAVSSAERLRPEGQSDRRREMRTATAERKSAASTSKKPARACKTVKCAFCGGTGRDPYRILSKVSDCPVCKGHKTVEVETPVVPCLYCRGTGRQRHTRLTCSACRGAGVITLPGPTAACVQCDGSGREPEADLPCSRCKGAGLVAVDAAQGKKTERPQEGSRKT
jgi:DnaJ-class molecular chaperone